MEERLEVTPTFLKANLLGIAIALPIVGLFILTYWFFWGLPGLTTGFIALVENKMVLWVTIVLGAIIHEGIHAIFWSRYCPNGFSDIKVGVKWKYLTPYCHCKVPLQVNQYKIGAIMPCLLMGVLPIIIAIALGIGWLLCAGLFFTLMAGGDLLILSYLLKYDEHFLMYDHPDKIGFVITKKDDRLLTNKEIVG